MLHDHHDGDKCVGEFLFGTLQMIKQGGLLSVPIFSEGT